MTDNKTLVSNVKLFCNFCTLQNILISINIFSFIQHFKDVSCIDNKLKIFQFVGLLGELFQNI